MASKRKALQARIRAVGPQRAARMETVHVILKRPASSHSAGPRRELVKKRPAAHALVVGVLKRPSAAPKRDVKRTVFTLRRRRG